MGNKWGKWKKWSFLAVWLACGVVVMAATDSWSAAAEPARHAGTWLASAFGREPGQEGRQQEGNGSGGISDSDIETSAEGSGGSGSDGSSEDGSAGNGNGGTGDDGTSLDGSAGNGNGGTGDDGTSLDGSAGNGNGGTGSDGSSEDGTAGNGNGGTGSDGSSEDGSAGAGNGGPGSDGSSSDGSAGAGNGGTGSDGSSSDASTGAGNSGTGSDGTSSDASAGTGNDGTGDDGSSQDGSAGNGNGGTGNDGTTSDGSAGTDDGAGSGPGEEDAAPQEVAYATVDDDYFSDALFIGDSRVVGLYQYSGLMDVATFYASKGLTVFKLFDASIVPVEDERGTITIEEALSEKQFKKVYLMVGINEMGVGDVEGFLAKYQEVVDRIQELQPDAILYLQAIIKVTAKRSEKGDYIYNEGIEERNVGIAAMADNKTVFYLDVNPLICDEMGGMIEEYTSDGVHLKAKYIPIWENFLKEHAILLDE